MKGTGLLLLLFMLCGAAACRAPGPGRALGSDFGNAIRHNLLLQAVSPPPGNGIRAVPDMAGPRAAGAIERYDAGEVIAPETIETTEFGE